MEGKRYADTFIYVPSVREIVMIAEGNRTNLLDEDEAEGYVDYIYYDQHELSYGMPECDGGQEEKRSGSIAETVFLTCV